MSGYAYGMANPYAPDPDTPRAGVDPSHGNTLYAHLADIQIAWAATLLTRVERRSVFLRFALGWSQRAIARHEGVAESTMSERLARSVGDLVTQLNSPDPTSVRT